MLKETGWQWMGLTSTIMSWTDSYVRQRPDSSCQCWRAGITLSHVRYCFLCRSWNIQELALRPGAPLSLISLEQIRLESGPWQRALGWRNWKSYLLRVGYETVEKTTIRIQDRAQIIAWIVKRLLRVFGTVSLTACTCTSWTIWANELQTFPLFPWLQEYIPCKVTALLPKLVYV